MEDISVQKFVQLVLSQEIKNYQIIDVREVLEYHTFNVGGLNIPLGKLKQLIDEDELEIDTQEKIIVICQRGLRSKTAKTILSQQGYKQVSNLLGGLIKLQQI